MGTTPGVERAVANPAHRYPPTCPSGAALTLPSDEASSSGTGVKVPVALCAGSFDPIHLGHLDVIARAAANYDHVVVGILANPDKPRGMFKPAQRVALVREATSHLHNVSCQQFHGLTVDLARSVGATVLIRVAHKERDNELSMTAMNLTLAGIPTIMFAAKLEARMISSSLVRDLIADGKLAEATELVPACVGRALAEAHSAALD